MMVPRRDPWQPWISDMLPPGSLDLLNTLRDIHEPTAPGFWPPAPGWWLLAVLLLALGAWLGLSAASRRRRRAPIRQAEAELSEWQRRAARTQDARAAADTLAELLKRAALCRYPRTTVAGLSGDAWLRFLDRTGNTTEFSNGAGRVLGDERYARAPKLQPEPLAQIVRAWLQRHLDGTPDAFANADANADADADADADTVADTVVEGR